MAGESKFQNIANNRMETSCNEMYPVVKYNKLILPEKFLSSGPIKINDANEFEDTRSSKDDGINAFFTLKAESRIPCCCGIYYFEMKLLRDDYLGFIGLGIANPGVDKGHQLGKSIYDKRKVNGSAGLYLNHHSVSLWMTDKEYPIAINEKMRVRNLGFGINFIENYVFCTVNGFLLLHMKELPPKEKIQPDDLYPAISSQSPQCSFSVNFGLESDNPFSFNFNHYKAYNLKKKRNQCLSQEYSPKLAFVTVFNLVSDYLLHHGYAEAWEALNKYDDSQSKCQSLETIRNRRIILKCILDEDYLSAISNIEKHFSDFFQQYPIYRFILKCRHFINMIVTQPLVNMTNGSAVQDQEDFVKSPKSARLDPILMKQKNYSRLVGSKVQAAVSVDSCDNCLLNKDCDDDDLDDDDDEMNSNYNNNNVELENMETEPLSDYEAKNAKILTNSSHLAGEHVLFIIQYGKQLKEEAQVFSSDNSVEHQKGLELLTSAFSLIAYRDPYSSPFKDILGSNHREDLAHKINGAINGMLGRTTKARLDSLLEGCLKETQENSKNLSVLSAIHPKLLISELFIDH